MSFKHLLTESYNHVQRATGVNMLKPNAFIEVLADPRSFSHYQHSLAEGLNAEDRDAFMLLSENTRVNLMENSMFQGNPYDTLIMPLLRNFYPMLIAREMVTTMPIDKPDIIKGFVRASFKKYGESSFGHQYPSYQDISRGPSIGVSIAASAAGGTTDMLAVVGLNSDNSHIEKDVTITNVYDSAGVVAAAHISPSVDGTFSAPVNVGGVDDVISGHFNFLEGTLTWSSAAGVVRNVDYTATASLEENTINPQIKYDIEKVRMTVVDRRISAEWTMEFQQDMRALYQVDTQAELTNLMSQQIALDIDNNIINSLLVANATLNPTTHNRVFNKTPPIGYSWGPKMWAENILPEINTLSAQIYNSTLMGSSNIIACNPLDAAIFESINGFGYSGNSTEGGEIAYRTAQLQGGKYKILVSSIVPEGKMLTMYKSTDIQRSVFVYAPYIPAQITPYPMGRIPALTVNTRYASKLLRPAGMGVITVI